MATRKSRSSLLSHTFPPFYACYLLKSVQTPRSTATYIGSTPNPPRRIRQHNGELTQGASQTKLHRPWVMQMIVHGFPSKLAALQFEWAWQHPYISRHLRDQNGKSLFVNDKKSKYLKMNIQIVRIMLSHHPYNKWPLHVKLFTEEAVRGWKNANANNETYPLPSGLIWDVEFEGVDGKSGKVGSGRLGPIDVKDEHFTSAYLTKHTALLTSNRRLQCSICKQALINYSTEPLTTALCPTLGCTSVSHIICLSKDFLGAQVPEAGLAMIPRGGECKSCQKYVLWGDVIRGCYRRSAGNSVICQPDDGLGEDGEADEGFEMDEYIPAITPTPPHPTFKKTTKTKSRKVLKLATSRQGVTGDRESSEGEFFDFGGIGSSTNSDEPPVALPSQIRGRPPKLPPKQVVNFIMPPGRHLPPGVSPSLTTRISKPEGPKVSPRLGKALRVTTACEESSEGEFFDFAGISSASDSDSPAAPLERSQMPSSAKKLATTLWPSARPARRSPENEIQQGKQDYQIKYSNKVGDLTDPRYKLPVVKRGEVDYFLEDDMSRGYAERDGSEEMLRKAMSTLSVTSPSAPLSETAVGGGMKIKTYGQRPVMVIELSD